MALTQSLIWMATVALTWYMTRQVARRVVAAVVPLVERPLADLVDALRLAVERVLDAVRVMKDVRVLIKVLARARERARFDLEGGDNLVAHADRGGGDGPREGARGERTVRAAAAAYLAAAWMAAPAAAPAAQPSNL